MSNYSKVYASGKQQGFDVLDTRCYTRKNPDGVVFIEQQTYSKTPFTCEVDGKSYPVYGMTVTTVDDGKTINDEAKRQERTSCELYIDMRSEMERNGTFDKLGCKNYAPMNVENFDYIRGDKHLRDKYGEVSYEAASYNVTQFNSASTFYPHIAKFEDFKAVKETKYGPDLVKRGFLDSAEVTSDDYSKYLDSVSRQVGVQFVGDTNINNAYQSCPELMNGGRDFGDE